MMHASRMRKIGWAMVLSGAQSALAKNNLQVPESAPEARALGEIILRALGRNPTFNSAAAPLRVFPPLFNRYDVGMGFKAHVDNAISKTVTVPATTDFATFRGIYEMADALALKGCAVYRTGTRGDAVMHCTQDACN